MRTAPTVSRHPKLIPVTFWQTSSPFQQAAASAAEAITLMEPPHPVECSPWTVFQVTFPDHVARYGQELIALPEGLLETLNEMLPGVLNDDDIAFESALRRAAGIGFSNRQPIHMPAMARRQKLAPTKEAWRDRSASSAAAIQEMLDEEMRRDGLNELEISERRQKAAEFERSADERELGYVAWLITCREFQRDLADFRKSWGTKIELDGAFPALPTALLDLNPPAVPPSERPFYDDYCSLFRKWCLHTLAGWDLPLPMQMRLDMPSLYQTATINEAGLAAFLPWYMLVKEVSLQDLIEQFGPPKHLRPWIEPGKAIGRKRSAIKLEVYLYVERGLFQRYRKRLGRNVESLDRVLSEYLIKRDVLAGNAENMQESIRKVRTLLRRELNALQA